MVLHPASPVLYLALFLAHPQATEDINIKASFLMPVHEAARAEDVNPHTPGEHPLPAETPLTFFYRPNSHAEVL